MSLPGGGWRRKWRSLAKRPIGSLFWGRARKQVAGSQKIEKKILFPYGKNASQGAPSFVEFVDEKETAARVEEELMAKLEPGRFF